MPRFAANLSMMYTEHAFLDRFAAAAKDGFRAAEFTFPYDFPAAEIRSRLDAHGLDQVLLNAPPGKWSEGERGLASIPGREEECKRGIALALEYALKLGAPRIHLMAGLLIQGVAPGRQRDTYLQNLAYAAAQSQPHGITVLIEPINTRDMPGYFLNRQDEAHAVCREIGAQNLKVQYDLYHAQIVEGDLTVKLERYLPGIGHIQIAGAPERHEPNTGEINYPFLFEMMDKLGYSGWVGCEYRPAKGTSEGLRWIKPWLMRS
ncbi:MAG: 2-oxo-tetronate isomerase [Terriglobia bacterium]